MDRLARLAGAVALAATAASCAAGPAAEGGLGRSGPAATTVLAPGPAPSVPGSAVPEPTLPEPTVPEPTVPEPTVPEPTLTVPPPRPAPVVEVRFRIERRTTDAATAGFADVVRATLADPRGWTGAGFRLVEDPAATYSVVLAEGEEVDRLCAPYRTGGRYSCQNGPVVALNADRWRSATDRWTGTLAAYRQMLVNHEVGHLLGRHHPDDPQCPAPGRPARVMAQQSTELDGCLPNPWPLPAELAAAARHDEPLAPPHEADP